MNDTFELIAGDAVDLLIATANDLVNSEDEGDKEVGLLIAITASSLTRRALAILSAEAEVLLARAMAPAGNA